MDHRPSTAPDLIAADLAPGDAGAAHLDWSGLRIERVRSAEHPLFRAAYERLRREFGTSGSMERKEVITARFARDPARPAGDHHLLYEMLVVRRGEEIVAVRDHTAILPAAARDTGAVIVHLSHNLIEPAMRGSGLAGWLRALPVQVARECAVRAGVAATHVPTVDKDRFTLRQVQGERKTPFRNRPDTARAELVEAQFRRESTISITLVAEMEQPLGDGRSDRPALRSYGRAGFLKIDPEVVPYCQPDFRAADEIERTGVQPVPYALVIRRVGRETERSLPGAEVRAIVTALYTMFGLHTRADHMASLWACLEHLPPETEAIALLPPASA
jgi:hypothetical protein